MSFLRFFGADRAGEKLRFFNEYGELETINLGYRVESSAGVAVVALVAGAVYIVSFLAICIMFTGENILVCCFCPDGGIWASGTKVEC